MIKGKFQWLMFVAVLFMPLIIRIKNDTAFYLALAGFAVLLLLFNFINPNSNKPE
jgi:hypothetical protein